MIGFSQTSETIPEANFITLECNKRSIFFKSKLRRKPLSAGSRASILIRYFSIMNIECRITNIE